MITAYRRHTQKCLGELAEKDWKSKTSEEIKSEIRDWKSCACPLWREGSYGRLPYERKSLGVTNWKTAERLIADMMREADANILDPKGINLTLHEALQRWHVACRLVPLSESTMMQHEHLSDALEGFCKARRITSLADVDATLLNAWRVTWVDIKSTTKRTRFSVIKMFFEYCVSQGWLALHPMRDMVVPRDTDAEAEEEDTQPLDVDGSDTNFDRIVVALASVEPTAARTHRPHNPDVTQRQCGCVDCRRECGRLSPARFRYRSTGAKIRRRRNYTTRTPGRSR